MNIPHSFGFRIRLILADLNIYKGPVLAFQYSVIPPWELPAVTFCRYFHGSKRNLSDSEIRSIFLDHKDEHKNSLSIFTDGSKSNAGVGFRVFSEESFRIFGDHDVLLRCFNSFILPCLEYCSPVWSSAADSHLKLLDKNLRAYKFLIPNLTISLQHHHFISSLCMLYKIFHNPSHPLHSELPNLFHPRRVTRGSLSINSLSFSPVRFHTSQYSRCFIPATTKLWNELPSMIVEATELQKFKIGANAFLCPLVFLFFYFFIFFVF